jgi:hypothetical protein
MMVRWWPSGRSVAPSLRRHANAQSSSEKTTEHRIVDLMVMTSVECQTSRPVWRLHASSFAKIEREHFVAIIREKLDDLDAVRG